MNPAVSVIIPTYNTAKYISHTLDSVLKQTFSNFEIVVVDDGSTDNTKEILSPYMDKINYIHQENSGRSEARNTGIKTAQGKYVAFLDSDDLWVPEKLEKQTRIMEDNDDIDFLFGDKKRFANDGRIIISSMFAKNGYNERFFGDGLYVRDPYRKLLKEPYIPTGTVMMKKFCFEQTGFFDRNIYAEDWEFWLRVALFKRMAYIDEIWELERDRPGSGSKNLKAVYLSHIDTLEKHENEFKPQLKKMNIDLNDAIRERYKNNGHFFLEHNKVLARKSFRKSLSRGFSAKVLVYWLATFLPFA